MAFVLCIAYIAIGSLDGIWYEQCSHLYRKVASRNSIENGMVSRSLLIVLSFIYPDAITNLWSFLVPERLSVPRQKAYGTASLPKSSTQAVRELRNPKSPRIPVKPVQKKDKQRGTTKRRESAVALMDAGPYSGQRWWNLLLRVSPCWKITAKSLGWICSLLYVSPKERLWMTGWTRGGSGMLCSLSRLVFLWAQPTQCP